MVDLLVEKVLHKKANSPNTPAVIQTDAYGNTYLHHKIIQKNHNIVKKILTDNQLRKLQTFKERNNTGFNVLNLAIVQREFEIAKLLLNFMLAEFNAKPTNLNGSEVPSPLHLAVREKSSEIVELLITKGMSVIVRDNDKSTPLHWLAHKEDCSETRKIASLLLDRINEEEINFTNLSGNTALHIAAEEPDAKWLVELLKVRNIDLNITNHRGETALYLAIKAGNKDVVRYLLNQKDISVNDRIINNGCVYPNADQGDFKTRRVATSTQTALTTAIDKNNDEALKLLISKGATLIDNGWDEFRYWISNVNNLKYNKTSKNNYYDIGIRLVMLVPSISYTVKLLDNYDKVKPFLDVAYGAKHNFESSMSDAIKKLFIEAYSNIENISFDEILGRNSRDLNKYFNVSEVRSTLKAAYNNGANASWYQSWQSYVNEAVKSIAKTDGYRERLHLEITSKTSIDLIKVNKEKERDRY